MATAVSTRPTGPHQKLKRPPLPAVQTTSSAPAAQPSPSPSANSKRLPPGLKQAGGAVSPGNAVNGPGARFGNRRRESQKLGDGHGRQARVSRVGQGDSGPDERRAKRAPEPYVKSTTYILKKYSKSPPSFVLHLHPTHFRFDEQDGSFSYTSPMRILLEHIKGQTVPHDMLDELVAAGIKFYDNCLIVQIQDHRNSTPTTQSRSTSSNKDTNQPFSIHNYTEHLTPSPFVPYPHSRTSDQSAEGNATRGGAPATGSEAMPSATRDNTEEGNPRKAEGPKIFTTVLFSTPLSLQDEILRYASTPDLRANSRKQSHTAGRTPGSATVPPTPSSAGFPGSIASSLPSKKQKLMYSRKTLSEIESKIISSTALPLFLDPVDNFDEAQDLLNRLKDPLLSENPAAPKSRKRTVAELAADEALAAEEQRFMLIMDERLIPGATTSNNGTSATVAGDTGAAAFEARFERFKAIEEIRGLLEEKRQRDQEAKMIQQQQQQKAKQEQQEQEAAARQQAIQEQKLKEANARRQEQIQQLQARQLQNQNQQILHQQSQAVQQGSSQHAHPSSSNGIMQSTHQLAVSQAHHASPIVRQMTPQTASSPLIGNSNMGHSGPAISMSVTNSNQGAGSPPRPGSAMQHAHPGVSMAPQRSQQPPSRNGTPAMANGTPRLQQATPIMRNVTPTPRISHASPVNSTMTSTPGMGHYMMGNPHLNAAHLTLQQQQQQQAIMQQRQQQNAFVQHQAQMQGSPQNSQMSPHNLQQLAAHQAHQQAQQRAAGTEMTYRQQLQNMQQQQMSNIQAGNHNFANNMPMHQVQMQQSPSHQAGNIQQGGPNKWQIMYQQQAQNILNGLRERAMNQYGHQIPPQVMQQLKDTATTRAKQIVAAKRNQEMFSRQQQMMGHQMQQAGGNMAGVNGMSNMNGMGGMGGMNGVNGMSGI